MATVGRFRSSAGPEDPQPPPVERLADRHGGDAVGGVTDRLLDHDAGVALLGSPIQVGQLGPAMV